MYKIYLEVVNLSNIRKIIIIKQRADSSKKKTVIPKAGRLVTLFGRGTSTHDFI